MKKLFILFFLIATHLSMFGSYKKHIQVSAELQDEISQQSLLVSGTIPKWLSGHLLRNGPIYVTVNGKTNEHWFDGLAMLHAFSFQGGQVEYSNRFLRTDAYQTVFEEGSLNYVGFAADPCRSVFKRFLTFFLPKEGPELQNTNVNIAQLADTYVALTEIPLPIAFDPQTLETLGVLDYQDELPHEHCWESAHPHHDTTRQETLNYLIEYGHLSEYVLYRIEDGSSERQVIARLPVEEPAYMHSFAVTEHYVIFTEFPFVVKPLDLITKKQGFIKNFSWHPERDTLLTVVERTSGHVVGQYQTEPFFAFHHVNAFEKDNSICMDIVCYQDPSIITEIATYFHSEDEATHFHYLPFLHRLTLHLVTGKTSTQKIFDKSVEFPRINERFDGKPYHYVYLTDPRKLQKDTCRSLYKVHIHTKKVQEWHQDGCCPGEPVFVPAPGATKEDEGVVLAVVLDTYQHTSFLLVLDAKSFKEIGRAQVPHAIPPGLHGQYFDHRLETI